jgi:hypothetical protein
MKTEFTGGTQTLKFWQIKQIRAQIIHLLENVIASDPKLLLWAKRQFYHQCLTVFWMGLMLITGSFVAQPLMLVVGLLLIISGGAACLGSLLYRLLIGKRGRRFVDEWLLVDQTNEKEQPK